MSKNASDILAAPSVPELAELQRQLVEKQLVREELETAELSERRTAKQEQDRIQMEVRKAGALSMQRAREQEEAVQRTCPHMKPNMQSALGGQRDHQGKLHLICAYCAKEFDGSTVPQHLKVPSSVIG